MAGGEGKRLRPLTEYMPKPMLKVCGRPILEIIIESLRNVGFKRIILAVYYLCHIIEDYFNNSSDFGVDIKYIRESKPLGTAGGLGLIPEDLRPKSPFLVINGDLLTDLDFKAVRDFHIAAHYDLTICSRPYQVKIPFGYPVINGDVVVEFQEKPEFTYLVNSGIYCISPELLDEVSVNEYIDMPDLIQRAIQIGKRVGVFPLRENFHEIGRLEFYEASEEFYQKNIEPKLNTNRK
jgi:NDP-sugar pyrophosphorylase family protein